MEKLKSSYYKRLKGHQKIPARPLCICGRKMLFDKRFSSFWGCAKEVEILNKLAGERFNGI